MAKKNNSNILLIAVAAGAFYFYGKVRSNLKDKQDAAKKAAEEAAAEAARLEKENKPATKTSAPVPSKAEKAYTDAVKKLQTALGVSPVTGFVGDKTKAALIALKLTDVVTAGNVADLITKVEAAKKAKPPPAAPKNLAATDLLNFAKKNPGGKVVFLERFTTRSRLLNPISKVYIDDPDAFDSNIGKGQDWFFSRYKPVATTTSNKIVFQEGKKYWTIPANKLIAQA